MYWRNVFLFARFFSSHLITTCVATMTKQPWKMKGGVRGNYWISGEQNWKWKRYWTFFLWRLNRENTLGRKKRLSIFILIPWGKNSWKHVWNTVGVKRIRKVIALLRWTHSTFFYCTLIQERECWLRLKTSSSLKLTGFVANKINASWYVDNQNKSRLNCRGDDRPYGN